MKKSTNIIQRSFIIFLISISVITIFIVSALAYQTFRKFQVSTSLKKNGVIWHNSYALDHSFLKEMILASLLVSDKNNQDAQKSYESIILKNDVLLEGYFKDQKKISNTFKDRLQQDIGNIRSLVKNQNQIVDILSVTEKYSDILSGFETLRKQVLEPLSAEQFALSQYLVYGSAIYRLRKLFYEESALFRNVIANDMQIDERISARFTLLRQEMYEIQNILKSLDNRSLRFSKLNYSKDYIEHLNDLKLALIDFEDMRRSIYSSALLGTTFNINDKDLQSKNEAVLNQIEALQELILYPAISAMERKVSNDFFLLQATGLISVFSFIMFFIIYSIQQNRVLKPIEKLTKNMHELAGGDLEIKLPESRPDEIGRIINALHVFRNNALELRTLHSNTNTMMESLEQGLLFFDENGICSSIYSTSCLKIFKIKPTQKFLPDLLNFNETETESFLSWLKIIFLGSSAMSFDDLKELIPREYINEDGLIIELDYKPMFSEEKIIYGVLLVARDVTYKRKAEAKIKETQQNAEKIQKISQNRNGFYEFITDIQNFIDDISDKSIADISDSDLMDFKRSIHTFKSTAGIWGLSKISEHLHEMESNLELRSSDLNQLHIQEDMTKLNQLVQDEIEDGIKLFGPDFMADKKIKTIEMSKLVNLYDQVEKVQQQEFSMEELRNFIADEILSVKIVEAFYPFQRELSRLAEQKGIPIPEFIFKGEDIKIIATKYEEFFKVLIHIARNIIDHGVEEPEERRLSGKRDRALVCIDVKKQDDKLQIIIMDDGRGVNPNAIKEKISKDSSDMSDQEVIQHIFKPNVSSKKTVSMSSGRGIGLNAVYETIKSMQGNIVVSSNFKENTGINFTITLPL